MALNKNMFNQLAADLEQARQDERQALSLEQLTLLNHRLDGLKKSLDKFSNALSANNPSQFTAEFQQSLKTTLDAAAKDFVATVRKGISAELQELRADHYRISKPLFWHLVNAIVWLLILAAIPFIAHCTGNTDVLATFYPFALITWLLFHALIAYLRRKRWF